MIPYGRQEISTADIDAVVDVLKSDFITQGPAVVQFEQAVASYCQARFAVAVNSATSGLHIACQAADIGAGDVVWTTPITFVASANCARFCGADVDFVDIDPETCNMSIQALQHKLKNAAKENKLPKAVIPVHFAGQSCDMAAIAELAEHYKFIVIEDASHAIGGKYQANNIGNCQYSEMTVFSFHPVKIITTGEGGVVVTNNKKIYDKLQLLRSHGVTRDEKLMLNKAHGPWYYQQISLGCNYRLTDLQAALGCSQLKRLDEFIEKRTQLAHRYDRLLTDLPVTTLKQLTGTKSAWHLYVICLQDPLIRKKLFMKLRGAGIGVNVHYIPVHTQPYYQDLGFKLGDFPVAENYYDRAITLPLYPGLSAQEQDYIVACIQVSLTEMKELI